MSLLNQEGPVDYLIKRINKSVSSYDLKIILLETYQIMYGIYNHNLEDNRPLALIAMHPKEDYVNFGPKYHFYKRYIATDIKNIFNLSLLEMLSFTRHECELLFKLAEQHNNRESKKTKELVETIRTLDN